MVTIIDKDGKLIGMNCAAGHHSECSRVGCECSCHKEESEESRTVGGDDSTGGSQ